MFLNCVNRQQLGVYWLCVTEDGDSFCLDRCDKCNICKEMSDVFAELQDSYFFILILIKQIIRKKFHINLFCGKSLLA